MKLSFVKFTDTGVKFKKPGIGISIRSGFTFNNGFYREVGLDKYVGVILSYDKSEKAIGFSFSRNANDHSIFKLTKRGKMGAIVAHSFFNGHKIDTKKYAGWYEPETYEDPDQGKIYYIKLDEKREK